MSSTPDDNNDNNDDNDDRPWYLQPIIIGHYGGHTSHSSQPTDRTRNHPPEKSLGVYQGEKKNRSKGIDGRSSISRYINDKHSREKAKKQMTDSSKSEGR